MGQIAYLPHF